MNAGEPSAADTHIGEFASIPMVEGDAHPDSSNRTLLAAWEAGDQSAAALLFQRYLVRLTALARSRLSRQLARRLDPEDIVLSAYRSFFLRAADGRIAAPDDDDLWPLLVVLVLRKIHRGVERNTAERRNVNRDVRLDSAMQLDAIAGDATPDQVVALEDELLAVLNPLSPREREIVSRRLQGESEQAIAVGMACSDRTVRRALARTRAVIVERGGIGSVRWPQAAARCARPPTPTFSSDEFREWPTVSLRDLRLHQLIGAGGVAKLYRATRLSDGVVVAVKFLRKRFCTDSMAVASMLNEARTLRTLNHPQIITLCGCGRSSEGAPFLVLPWIDGEDFDTWSKRSKPDVEQIVSTMLSVSGAVDAAHSAGIIHCDLKPANFLINRAGQTYLTDFGFARSVFSHEDALIRGGTPAFFAPEQCSDVFGPVDARTDIYGLGATLYAMLAGRPPFTGPDTPTVIAQIVSSRAPLPPSVPNPAVPAWLDAIVLRCLCKEPAERYQRVDELATAIRANQAP